MWSFRKWSSDRGCKIVCNSYCFESAMRYMCTHTVWPVGVKTWTKRFQRMGGLLGQIHEWPLLQAVGCCEIKREWRRLGKERSFLCCVALWTLPVKWPVATGFSRYIHALALCHSRSDVGEKSVSMRTVEMLTFKCNLTNYALGFLVCVCVWGIFVISVCVCVCKLSDQMTSDF